MKQYKLYFTLESKTDKATVQASNLQQLKRQAAKVFNLTFTSVKIPPFTDDTKLQKADLSKEHKVMGTKEKTQQSTEEELAINELSPLDHERFRQAISPNFFAFIYDTKNNDSADIMAWVYATLKMPQLKNWLARQPRQAANYSKWEELRPKKPKPIRRQNLRNRFESSDYLAEQVVYDDNDEAEDRTRRLENETQFMEEYKAIMLNSSDRYNVLSQPVFSLQVAWQNYRGWTQRSEPLKVHPKQMIQQWYGMLNIFNQHPYRQAEPISKTFGICSQWKLKQKRNKNNQPSSDFLNIFVDNQAMFLEPYITVKTKNQVNHLAKIINNTKVFQTDKPYIYDSKQYTLDLRFIRFSQYLPTYLFIFIDRYNNDEVQDKEDITIPKYLDVSKVCSEQICSAATKPQKALDDLIEKYRSKMDFKPTADAILMREKQMDFVDSQLSERRYKDLYYNMHEGYYSEFGTMSYNLVGFMTHVGHKKNNNKYGFVGQVERDKWMHLVGEKWQLLNLNDALTQFNGVKKQAEIELAELLIYRKIYVDYRE